MILATNAQNEVNVTKQILNYIHCVKNKMCTVSTGVVTSGSLSFTPLGYI